MSDPWMTSKMEAPPASLTKSQRAYMQRARAGVLAVGNAAQIAMQKKLVVQGLVARDHYGYFVLTDEGRAALDGQ